MANNLRIWHKTAVIIDQIERNMPEGWYFVALMRVFRLSDDDEQWVAVVERRGGLPLGAIPEIRGVGRSPDEAADSIMTQLTKMTARSSAKTPDA